MAVSRLRSCERSFWHATTMLVGRCVMRTAESAVLTPCPPGPDERKTSTRSSSSRISTSTSSTSGTTDTDAKLVCRRLEASKGEMRIEPVHAGLAAQVAVGVLAGHLDGRRLDPRLFARQQVDDLGLEPRALAPAQVHAHEHLRPVLGLGAAGAGMDGQDRRLGVVRAGQHDLELELVQLAPRGGARPRRSRHRGCRRRRPPGPSSSRTARSEACVVSSPTRPTVRDSSVRSRISSWARRLSSQKAGAAISVSSAARRFSLPGRSKMPPQLVHPTGQLRDVALQLAEHGLPPGRPTPTERPTPPATATPPSRRAA